MIIPLTRTVCKEYNVCVNPDSTINLCNYRLVQLGAPEFVRRFNMVVRFKNPKKKGFVKVILTKKPFKLFQNSINSIYWEWKDSLGVCKYSNNRFFTNTDEFITKMFPNRNKITVWIDFKKA